MDQMLPDDEFNSWLGDYLRKIGKHDLFVIDDLFSRTDEIDSLTRVNFYMYLEQKLFAKLGKEFDVFEYFERTDINSQSFENFKKYILKQTR